MELRVRRATPDDAGRVSALAEATFRDAFADANTPENMAAYVAATFSPARQAAEIADPGGLVLLGERPDPHASAELIGYAHLVEGPAPHAVGGPRPVELKRLYVARPWHGRQVAQALMDAAVAEARARGGRTLWLGVWEHNPRAVAFYRKCGFVQVGRQTFRLGDDDQTDFLLSRPL